MHIRFESLRDFDLLKGAERNRVGLDFVGLGSE
jgi:hypothetical protein